MPISINHPFAYVSNSKSDRLLGNVNELRNKLLEFGRQELSDEERHLYRERIARDYNWSNIAAQTIAVYEQVLSKKML